VQKRKALAHGNYGSFKTREFFLQDLGREAQDEFAKGNEPKSKGARLGGGSRGGWRGLGSESQ